MKKWTKAARAEASRKGKERWAARKKRDVRSNRITDLPSLSDLSGGAGSSGGSASASSYVSANEALAIDIVAMLRNEAIPSPLLLKVVERILNGVSLISVTHPGMKP